MSKISNATRAAARTAEAEPLWTVPDVATYLGVPEATVYRWNYRGEGPAYLRVGKHARYRREDVEAWLAQRAHGGSGAA